MKGAKNMARMTNTELIEYNKKRKVCQICIATRRNIEEVLDEWIDKLKVGPWTVLTMSDETVLNPCHGDKKVEGKFKFYCALAMYGNIQIEILQPVYGYFPAEDFLNRTGGGLQHFKEQFSTDEEMQVAVKQMEAMGIRKTFNGGIKEDRFCNFDSESVFGFAIEYGNFANITLSDDMAYIYPRED